MFFSQLKLALKTMKSWGTVWCILLFALAWLWILDAAGQSVSLFKEKSLPLTLMGSCADGDAAAARLQKNITAAYAGPCLQSTLSWTVGKYRAEVTALGVEEAYLSSLYALMDTDTPMPVSLAMPYLIVDQTALELLKNEDKEQLFPDGQTKIPLDAKLDFEDACSARVIGVLAAESPRNDEEKTEELAETGTIYMGADWLQKYLPQITANRIVILLEQGFSYDRVSEACLSAGIMLDDSPASSWESRAQERNLYLLIGIFASACVCVLCFYQWRFWQARHAGFLMLLQTLPKGEKRSQKVFWYRLLVTTVLSCMMAVLIYAVRLYV